MHTPHVSSKKRPIAALAFLLAAIGVTPTASATGMQGHIYMAQCAAEQVTDPRLRALFDAHRNDLSNGAFFPDSGYTADDHDQGEIPHWEQYVQGYVEVIRARYEKPFENPESAAHVAFLMGLAAHGITDSTFDSLLYERADGVDPGDMKDFDMAMDIFLVHDHPRYYLPEIAIDTKTQSEIFHQKINHPVSPEAIDAAMSTAWSGISVVAQFLYLGADEWGTKFPWARKSLRDPRTPGGYPFGARVTAGYYREILRRLDGNPSASDVVIGAYPDDAYPLATLDNTRPDGKIVLFFGEGMDRATIDDAVVTVHDAMGQVVPTTVSVYRGDQWANVLRVTAQAPWQPSTKYTAVLHKSIKTLSGASPTDDLVFSFTTCTPASPGGDCEAPIGPPPPSACPELDAAYSMRPEEPPPEEPEEPPPPGVEPAESSGCTAAPGRDRTSAWSLLALAGACSALLARRRGRG
ncbi:Ig-like domain-containing protein [Polyangium aurulentum]|uniref:Ig-like domain-containing protein n=1 Tax=Polyangium aurulentum TaxID=2567896 RepID=UPI00146D2810|nr:Ig-like domain-containing protein [Polyangium aurulentum]UQA56887.1 Ig-like domain-containing protein [Polyangium aurulentum]